MKTTLNKKTFTAIAQSQNLTTRKEWLKLLRELRGKGEFARADDVRAWFHAENKQTFDGSMLSAKTRSSRGR